MIPPPARTPPPSSRSPPSSATATTSPPLLSGRTSPPTPPHGTTPPPSPPPHASPIASATPPSLASGTALTTADTPHDHVCFAYRANELCASLGIPAVLKLLATRLQNHHIIPEHRADLLTLAASLLGTLRDFDRAHSLLLEARSLRPESPWILFNSACLLQQQDRREEALAATRDILSAHPSYVHAIALSSDLLVELNRDDDAATTLLNGAATTESADLRWRLFAFTSERDQPDDALHWLAEYERCSPLLNDAARSRLSGNRAGLHLRRGDLDAARSAATTSGGPFYLQMAENLARPDASSSQRIRLPVGFVRQHHLTCAPATLSALAAFWGHPAPHTEIAERICYDGTSSFSERSWAETQNLDGREFTVTPDIARALISRGVPFTLVTTWTNGAHLQAVIGIDERAGLLLIRDPTHPHHSEALLDGFLADYAAHGPRGMLVLPASEHHRTDGLDLPEAPLHNLLHNLEGALQQHDRPAAQLWLDQLTTAAPNHRLTWIAQCALAAYDDDPVKSHEAQNALAALFPKDAPTAWRAFRANLPRTTRTVSLETLEQRIRQPDCDDQFKGELARLLARDSRSTPRAARIVLHLLRRNPRDGQSLTTLAECLAAADRRDDALELYRFAATSAAHNEICAANYFSSCRQLNRTSEGLDFLRRRTATLGHLAAAPWITLADSLTELLRHSEALDVITEARRLRPNDGLLILHEAALHRAQGNFDDASRILASAWRMVPDQDWHRHAATLAQIRGDAPSAISSWHKVLATEPLSIPAHENLVSLTAETSGIPAALDLLDSACRRFPWHMGLARLHVSWLRRDNRPEADAALLRMLAHNPADDWAWRERALELSARNRHSDATAAAQEALRLTPQIATSHHILASVLHTADNNPDAHAACLRALEIDVSCGAMDLLLASAPDSSQRSADIRFLRSELTRQSVGGEAVAQFHEVALPHLSTEEMTDILSEGLKARPDIWETWSTLALHRLNHQHPEALHLTRQLTTRFPFAPGSWRIHAQSCAAAGLRDEQLNALQHAVAINPRWSLPARELADLLEREGRFPDALAELNRLVLSNPLDPANHGVLADFLLRNGHTADAITAIERAVALEPCYSWGWSELARQARISGNHDRALHAARQLTSSRPDEPRSWINLAEMFGRLQLWDLASAEVDKALTRWPRNTRLHELRAQILAASGQRDAAIAACSPKAFGSEIPRELRGRLASLLLDAADYSTAESVLNKLIAAEPDYAWPRHLLYGLARSRNQNPQCLTLARDLVRIEPSNAVAFAMLAESLMAASRSDEAISAIRRALQLDPASTFAANHLLDDLLHRQDFAAADELAALIARFQHPATHLLARTRILLARKEFDQATSPTLDLALSPDQEAVPALAAALRLWDSTEETHKERIDQLICAAVNDGSARNVSVSFTFVTAVFRTGLHDALRKAIALTVPSPLKEAIIRDCFYRASDSAKHDAALKAFHDHQDLMRTSTQLWGAASYVLYQAGRRRELIDWCQDWQSRTDREPWMTANLALALVWERGPTAASAAWEDVLAAGAGSVWTQAASGLSFTRAILSRTDDARRLLDNLAGESLTAEDRFSAALARIALAAAASRHSSAWQRRKSARAGLRAASDVWTAGFDSQRGQHYLRELKTYLSQNGLDPAFARLPGPWRRKLFPKDRSIWIGRILTLFLLSLFIALVKCRDTSQTETVPIRYFQERRITAPP
jgi:cellulose synthase operon protein C